MSVTIVPLHNLHLPAGSVVPFGKFNIEDVPEWLLKDSILKDLSSHDRKGVKKATQALVSEYVADSYGFLDPQWTGNGQKGIQDLRWQSALLANIPPARPAPAVPAAADRKRLLKRISEIGRAQRELLGELTNLIDAHAPQLLAQPGCATMTAAIIIGHTAAAQRFPTDGHFARHAGTAPIPAPAATPTATAYTAAASANSTARSTSSRLARQNRPRHPRLPRSQTRRRQDQARSHPLPQTPTRPPHLAPALHHADFGAPAHVDQSLKLGNTDFHLTQEQPIRSQAPSWVSDERDRHAITPLPASLVNLAIMLGRFRPSKQPRER